jgi:hypothetical protein
MRVVERLTKGLMMLVLVAVLGVLLGFVIEHLWNWLMPAIFGLRMITYWQAVGLFLLGKILLGGFHKHGRGGGRRQWRDKMERKWAKMSPEEREKFRSGMKGRCGGFGGRGWRRGPWTEEGKEETQREVERG